MKKYICYVLLLDALLCFSGCSNSTEPDNPIVFEDKLEFGIKQYIDSTYTKFNFVVRDTFTKGDEIFGRITTKDILKSDTKLFFTVIRTNGDSVAVMWFLPRDTNTVNEFYTSGFGKQWSGGHFGKVYRQINWKKYLLDSTFFFIKTQ